MIDAVAGALSEAEMTTAATLVNNISDYSDPNVVKVVVSAAGRALYFSSTIPFVRDLAEESPEQQLQAFPFLKHLGIYGYRCEALRRLVDFPPSRWSKPSGWSNCGAGEWHRDCRAPGGIRGHRSGCAGRCAACGGVAE